MSGLFGSPPSPPPPPEVKPPAPMPDVSSAGALEARRNQQLAMLSRAGRSSTILTDPSNRPNRGGGDYSQRTLGTTG